MVQVEQEDARSGLNPGGARGDERERGDNVEFGRRGEQMVGEPEGIEAPFLGTFGDVGDGVGSGHPEAKETETDADLKFASWNNSPARFYSDAMSGTALPDLAGECFEIVRFAREHGDSIGRSEAWDE
jgi:hypothetical protein